MPTTEQRRLVYSLVPTKAIFRKIIDKNIDANISQNLFSIYLEKEIEICSINDCFMQLLSVSLKSRQHESELVDFKKGFTKTLKRIRRSVLEQTMNFFLLDGLKIDFVDVCIHICK